MAPKSTKSKKATEVQVPDTEVPKKGRGKTKKIEEVEEENTEIDMEVKTTTTEKKKRGKKAADEKEESNGKTDEAVPPLKKGRKKKIEEPIEQEEEADDKTDTIDDAETLKSATPDSDSNASNEALTNGKGKKQIKKVEKPKEPKSKKNKPDAEDNDEEEEASAPKVAKSRGRKAQPKEVTEPEKNKITEPTEEEVKPELPTKGRKKAAAKPTKTKQMQEEQLNREEEKEDTTEVEKIKEKPKNGRKNQTKKTTNKAADNGEKVSDQEEDDSPALKKQKVDDGKGEPIDEEMIDEVPEVKPAKGRRGRKPAEPAQELEGAQDSGETNAKRRRKPNEEKVQEDVKMKAPKNKNTTDYDSINFTNSSSNAHGKAWNFKICSWNVDGIRAWMGKGGLDYLKHEKPDILCLQEVKCSREKLPEEVANVPGYHAYWLCSDQDGYAGVGIYTSKLAMNVQYGLQDEELDTEGRIITAEYEQFYLICTYVPNAGRKLVTLPKRLQWNDAFRKYVKELDKKKPVIICGDMNVAHNEIDLANPKTNRKNAGFTEEERSGMTDLLGDGFVDTFRHLNPEKTSAYTFWTYMMNSRAKNVGWRLDYFIVSERLLPSLCDSTIRDQVYGSDHCPISLFLHLTSADKPKEEN